MGKIILYHGTPDKIVVPTFGLGNNKHDYGRGFYLTEDVELAKEWAVSALNDGYSNRYTLDTEFLNVLSLNEKSTIDSQVTIGMTHRMIQFLTSPSMNVMTSTKNHTSSYGGTLITVSILR